MRPVWPTLFIERLLAVIPIACVCLGTGLVIATCHYGFDFLDESFYLLSLQATPSDFSLTSTFFYLRPLYRALGENLTLFRIAGVIMLTGSAAVFAREFLKFQAEKLSITGTTRLQRLTGFCFILMGAAVYYYPYIRTPSYNLGIAIVANLFAAFACRTLTADTANRFRQAAFAIGVMTCLGFFIKITTAPLFGFLAALMLLLARQPLKLRLQAIFLMILGAAAWALVHFGLLQSFPEWRVSLERDLSYLQTVNDMHSYESVLRYIKEMATLFYRSIRASWPALIPLTLGIFPPPYLARKFPGIAWRPTFLVLALLGVSALEIEKKLYGWQFAKQPLLTSYTLWLVVLGAGLLLTLIKNRRSAIPGASFGWKIAAQLSLMALIPAAAAFGTGNPLPVNIMFSMAPLFAVLLAMADLLGRRSGATLVAPLTMALVACLSLAQIASASVHPYGLYNPVFKQTKAVRINNGTILRVDGWSRDFITQLQQAAKDQNIKPGSDILVFFDTPGVAYIMGGQSPLTPTYISDNPAAVRALLASLPAERVERAYIMYKQANTVPLADLLPPGIDLTHDFQYAGQVGSSIPFGVYDLWVPTIATPQSQ